MLKPINVWKKNVSPSKKASGQIVKFLKTADNTDPIMPITNDIIYKKIFIIILSKLLTPPNNRR